MIYSNESIELFRDWFVLLEETIFQIRNPDGVCYVVPDNYSRPQCIMTIQVLGHGVSIRHQV